MLCRSCSTTIHCTKYSPWASRDWWELFRGICFCYTPLHTNRKHNVNANIGLCKTTLTQQISKYILCNKTMEEASLPALWGIMLKCGLPGGWEWWWHTFRSRSGKSWRVEGKREHRENRENRQLVAYPFRVNALLDTFRIVNLLVTTETNKLTIDT